MYYFESGDDMVAVKQINITQFASIPPIFFFKQWDL